MNIWMVRSGKNGDKKHRNVKQLAYESQFGLIGWGKLPCLMTFIDKAQECNPDIERYQIIWNLISKKYPNKTRRTVSNDSRQIFNFLFEISVGDICIVPQKLEQTDGYVLGHFTGEYQYLPHNPYMGTHGKPTRWATPKIPRSEIDDDYLNQTYFDKYQTIFQLAGNGVEDVVESLITRFPLNNAIN